MPPDSIGNTLATAKQIFPIVSTQTSTEFIGVDAGTLDANDYYSFKLARTSSFTLSLTGLSADANIEILTSTGAIATDTDGSALSSSNTGTLTESLNSILNPGTYYIRVFSAPATDPLTPLTTTPSTNYSLNVAANSNTKTDILWRNYATGANVTWVMDGTTLVSVQYITPVADPNWVIQATGDFNSDGNTDLVWRNYATGREAIWLMDGTTLISSAQTLPAVTDFNWQIQGTGDFNGDGNPELVWRNYATGQNVLWFLNGTTFSSSVYLEALPGANVRIQAVADFNNDGSPDILWRNYAPSLAANNNFIWLMNGATHVGSVSLPAVPDFNWRIEGTFDLNNDGKTDIFWRNPVTGKNVVWYLDGTTFTSSDYLVDFIDNNWRATPPFNRLLPAVRADIAGDTTTTAFSIGPVNGSGTYRDTVGGADTSDYYQFSLGSVTQISLALTGVGGGALNGNLDLQLYNAFGGVVASSANGGNAAESFTVNGLVAGTYYIQVAATAGSSAYDLNLSANNLPVLVSNNALTLSEGSALTISNTLLQVTDENNTSAQLAYTLVVPPDSSKGALSLNGAAIAQNGIFTQADINAGQLSYSQNGSETLTDSFVFSVSDGVGGSVGNTTFTINTIPVNDPPILVTKQALTLSEGSAASLSSLNLLVTDVEQTAAQLIYSLNSLPTNGSLLLSNTAIAAGSTFTQADVSSGTKLSYSHNGSETTNDSFSFTVTDGAGGTVILSPQTLSIAVTPVNDAPVLISNQGLTVTEGAAPIITSALLQTSDAEFTGTAISPQLPDQIIYTVGTLPINGTLFVGTNALTANGTFTQADVNNNRILYNHNGSKTNSDSFVFHVSDGNTITTDSTFNIIVSPVNSPPVLSLNAGLAVSEGATANIGSTLLQVTDPDNPPPQVKYTLGQKPVNGDLKLNGTALLAGQTFTQQDINTLNRLTYQHNGSETTSDSFSFTASDPFGATIPSTTFSIAVTSVNDAPALLSNVGLTLSEGSTSSITTTLLSATDVDNLDSQITYTVSTPAHGSLLLGATTVTSFTQADLAGGQLKYAHDGSESISDSFTFTLSDGTATIAPKTFNIAVIPVNDPPGISNNLGLTLAEGGTTTIANAALLITDNDGPGPLTYTLGAGTTKGALKLGTATLIVGQTFTQADIAGSRLSYTHDGTETIADSFSFTASDSSTGTIALTTFSINVTPVNDAPLLTVPGFQSIDEDLPLAFTGANRISVSDADISGNPLVVTLSASGGTLSLNPGSLTVNNNSTGQVTLTGQLTAVNNALSSLTYRGLANFNGPDTIAIAVSDQGSTGAGGTKTDTKTIDLIVNPINDAPTLTVPGLQTVLEDATLSLAGLIDTTDVDSGTNPVKVNLTVANGALTLGTTGGLTFTDTTANGSGTIAVTGTIDSVRAALATLSYQGNVNYFGADTITIKVDDQGAVGASGALNIQKTIAVNVISVNDVPSFTAGTNLAINEDAGAQTVNWATGIATGPANEANQTLNFITSNNNASLFTTAPMIDPSGKLTYTSAPNANGVATVTVNLKDNGGVANGGNDTSPASTFTITVNPVNDVPSFTKGANQTITEDAGAQTITGWATGISAGPADEAAQTLNFLLNTDNPSLFSVAPTIDPATGNLTYTAAPNANGTAIVTVQLKDNGGTDLGGVDTSALQTFTINVTAVNDAPVFTLPNPPSVSEDTTLAIAGISLTDVDSGSSSLVVTLAANNGALQLGNTAGLTITAGSNNSSSVAFSGNLNDINAALSGLSYRGNLNFNGADTLTLTANDQGAAGSGAIGIDNKTLGITVTAVNDAPVVNVPGNQTVDEDTNLLLSGINVTDADSNPNPITVTLSAANGTLTLDPLVAGSPTLTLTNTLDNINTAIANLTYRGNLNYNGADTITVRANDQGNTGFGGFLTDLKTISVNVNAVNDAPTLTLPSAQIVNEDTNLVFNAGRTISLTDVDSGANPIQVNFAVSNGTLTLGAVGGGGALTGNGTGTVTYIGTLAALSPVLNTLTYRGKQDYFGSDTLNITVNDQGNTGSGSPGIATGSVAITVNSVNDAPVLLTNRALTLSEGTSSVITNSQLRTTDVDNTPDQLVYTLFSAPNPLTSGSLRLSNGGGTTVTLATGGSFTQADVNSGYLSYVQNGSETTSDSFTFKVFDNTPGSITIPGSGNATFNIVINPVNDAPTIVNNARLNLTEGATSTISSTFLSVSDADNTTAQLKYTLSSAPNNGSVRLNGSAITIGQTFTQADINSSRISYRHNGSETTSDSFIFAVNDGAGGTTGSKTFNIGIAPVNDAPTIVSQGPATVNEGATLNITNMLLRTSDPDNLTSELIYTLPTVPVSGTLFLNGTALVGGATVTQQQIDQGALTYVHNGSEPSGNDIFVFQVSDGTTTLSSRVFNINVNPINDPPVLVSNTGLLLAGDAPSLTVIGSDLLQVTDVDNTTAQLTYTLTSVPNPTVGILRLNGSQVSAGQAFTQADIDSGNLSFDYLGNGNSETFQFTVSDGGVGGTLSNAFFYINFSYS